VRRLHEQAIDRAHSVLHRNISRRLQRVDELEERLRTGARNQIALRERRRRDLESRLRQFDLRPRLRRAGERLNIASYRVQSLMRTQLHQRRQRFETLAAKLEQLNPRLVLSRGYAIVLNESSGVVREAAEAPVGSEVKILLEKDTLTARVTGS
jgi:exodeoxyribonuclease VII large subunit